MTKLVEGCELCNKAIRNNFDEIELASGASDSLWFGEDSDGKLCIWIDRDRDAFYHPRYCPECGRRL